MSDVGASSAIPTMQQLLAELVELLTSGNMTDAEREQSNRDIVNASQEIEWADSDAQAYAIAIVLTLSAHSASGDKVDEVFDQVGEIMGDDFPAYPSHFSRCLEFFEWVDPILADWTIDGGYDLVDLDDMTGEDMVLYVVNRIDVARIFEIASALGFRVTSPLDEWRRIEAMAKLAERDA